MFTLVRFGTILSALFALSALSGCASTVAPEAEVHYFAPIPVGEIGAHDLEPVVPRSAAELLTAANDAFAQANRAQERGDQDEAYRSYTLMMELLLESDLDPTVFYNLRQEFAKILSSSTMVASNTNRTQPRAWNEDVVELAKRSELEFPNPLNDRVLAEIESIRSVYPANFQAGLNRSGKYLSYIQAEMDKAGLPTDLVWLAMVESQFTPRINSRAGAGGMWQFMRSTGRRYGLETDYFVDERYDWKEATKASIAYLTELYDIFDQSWPLAISAYNMGEAGLERAIAANGGDRNLWSLIETPPAANRIRRETKKFYPKLLASIIIANSPEKYGFKYEPQPVERTEYATVSGQYYLTQIEEEAGLPKGTLAKLNPQFYRGYTPPGKSVRISVPLATRTKVARAIDRLPELRPSTHIVQSGDTLSGIAALHGVSVRALQTSNNIRSPRRLQIGQRLVVPGTADRSSAGSVATNAQGVGVYTVARGDSLSRIASRHGVSVKDLQAWNNLGRSTRIHVGDRLRVATAQPVQSKAPRGDATVYVVKAGDYPARIAKEHGVALGDFLAWNGLTRTSMIRVGQSLKLYRPASSPSKVAKSESSAASTNRGTHTVRKGENASTIAKKYGVRTSELLAWNGLTTRSILGIGDLLAVRAPDTVARSEDGRERIAAVAPPAVSADRGPAATGLVKVLHIVKRGQNPTTIAQSYGVLLVDLFSWNDWTDPPVLQIGEEVVVMSGNVGD